LKVKLGFNIYPKAIIGQEIGVNDIKVLSEIAKRADEAGLYYLAVPDTVSRPIPKLSSLIYLSALASITQEIKLGSCVLQVPLRNPIMLARDIVTLDLISSGRLIFGVGVGWVQREYEDLGIPFHERGRLLDEALDILKKLWTEPVVTYSGKYFRFKDVVMEPKPVQKPHPPIWIGGDTDRALKRVAKFGDGWLGTAFPHSVSPEGWSITERIETLKEFMKKEGRDPSIITISMVLQGNINPNREDAIEDTRRYYLGIERRTRGGAPFEMLLKYGVFGPAEDVIEKIKELKSLGADLIVLWIATTDLKTQWERVEKEILPSI